MSRIRTAVVLGAVLLWAVTPTLACLLPGLLQTEAERQCCQHMAEHCGQSDMPASHSCCQAPTRPESALVKGQVKLPSKNTIAAVAAAMQIHGPSDAAVPVRVLAFCESPPDQLPSHSSSILRI